MVLEVRTIYGRLERNFDRTTICSETMAQTMSATVIGLPLHSFWRELVLSQSNDSDVHKTSVHEPSLLRMNVTILDDNAKSQPQSSSIDGSYRGLSTPRGLIRKTSINRRWSGGSESPMCTTLKCPQRTPHSPVQSRRGGIQKVVESSCKVHHADAAFSCLDT